MDESSFNALLQEFGIKPEPQVTNTTYLVDTVLEMWSKREFGNDLDIVKFTSLWTEDEKTKMLCDMVALQLKPSRGIASPYIFLVANITQVNET